MNKLTFRTNWRLDVCTEFCLHCAHIHRRLQILMTVLLHITWQKSPGQIKVPKPDLMLIKTSLPSHQYWYISDVNYHIKFVPEMIRSLYHKCWLYNVKS